MNYLQNVHELRLKTGICQRHSLRSSERPLWNANSRLRPFKYWHSGINGIGGLRDGLLNVHTEPTD